MKKSISITLSIILVVLLGGFTFNKYTSLSNVKWEKIPEYMLKLTTPWIYSLSTEIKDNPKWETFIIDWLTSEYIYSTWLTNSWVEYDKENHIISYKGITIRSEIKDSNNENETNYRNYVYTKWFSDEFSLKFEEDDYWLFDTSIVNINITDKKDIVDLINKLESDSSKYDTISINKEDGDSNELWTLLILNNYIQFLNEDEYVTVFPKLEKIYIKLAKQNNSIVSYVWNRGLHILYTQLFIKYSEKKISKTAMNSIFTEIKKIEFPYEIIIHNYIYSSIAPLNDIKIDEAKYNGRYIPFENIVMPTLMKLENYWLNINELKPDFSENEQKIYDSIIQIQDNYAKQRLTNRYWYYAYLAVRWNFLATDYPYIQTTKILNINDVRNKFIQIFWK